jgi:hypothetical protein
MAKVLAEYRGFVADDIDGRSSNTCTHAVVGSTVECVNITTSKIRTVLGEDNNSVFELCSSDKVNQWAGFGPTVRTVTGIGVNSLLVNSVPTTNCSMGSFAGYNHDAVAPYFLDNNHTNKLYVVSGGTAGFDAYAYIGEPKYVGGDIIGYSGCEGYCMAVYDDTSYVAHAYSDPILLDATDTVHFHVEVENVTVNKTYNCRMYLMASTSGFDTGNIVGKIPGLANYDVDVEIFTSTFWYYAGDAQTAPGSWTVPNPGLNLVTGYWSANYFTSTESYDTIAINVSLYDGSDNLVGGGDVYNAAYTANTHITPASMYLGMTNIPSSGYYVIVSIYEPW